jgi:DNA (cytosine-5)-methyltransferase 1
MGWKPTAFSEIEKFPCEVLKHHYPNVPNLGDMTKYKEWVLNEPIDILVGGTPCQSFSVAGLRKGLDDPRGNLALIYVGILDKFRPKWFVWENVPGVLSSGGGRDFGSFLGAVGEVGYGWAYRVLDAQYFGVAQRRRRVFVVGCLGNWESAAKVLFESESLSGNTKSSRKTRQETSNSFIPSVVGTLDTECGGGRKAHQSAMSGHFIPTFWNGEQTAETLTRTSDDQRMSDKNRFQAVIQAYENHGTDSRVKEIDVSPTVTARWGTGGNNVPLAQSYSIQSVLAPTLTTNDPSRSPQASEVTQQVNAVYQSSMAVRRLTEVECERLQGFPDNYTNIKENCPSGARYKALGNSMAVPVMKWIGERINDL